MRHPRVGVARIDGHYLESIRNGAWEGLAEKMAVKNTVDLSKDAEPNLLVDAINAGWSPENLLMEFGAGTIPQVRSFRSDDLPSEASLAGILASVGLAAPSAEARLPESLRETRRLVVLQAGAIDDLRNRLEVANPASPSNEDNRKEIGEARAIQALHSTLVDAIRTGSDVWLKWESRLANRFRIGGGGCRVAEMARAIASRNLHYFSRLEVDAEKSRILSELTLADHSCEARAALVLSPPPGVCSFGDPWDVTAFLYLLRAAKLAVSPLVREETNHRIHGLVPEEEARLTKVAIASKAGTLDRESLDTIARETGNELKDLLRPEGKFQYELRAVAGEVASVLGRRAKGSRGSVTVCVCV